MELTFEGYYQGLDEYGRVVINHDDNRMDKYDWWKWNTKIIGRTDNSFIGMRLGKLANVSEFREGDQVKVHFKRIKCPISKNTSYRLSILTMTLIG